jgi:hypothetical protein
LRPEVAAPDCASAALAANPVIAQSAQAAKPRRVSMMILPFFPGDLGRPAAA